MADIKAKPPRDLNLPPSSSVVSIHAIDTTLNMFCKTFPFVAPVIPGHEFINFPTLAFLIENKALGKKILFDVGGRTDYWNYAPHTAGLLRASSAGMKCDKGVDEVLLDAGIDLESLDSIVWSHWHFDHIGDSSKFPDSVEIIVGAGFVDELLPGYPTNPKSPLLETDYIGHELKEISFDDDFKIGRFRAHDFFGDGSFYLLDVPGHATGHMCGLVRTTTTTFVLLGADTCHITGCFRPSEYNPLPATLLPSDGLDPYFPATCPCSMFTSFHPAATTEEEARVTPYYKASDSKGSAFTHPKIANDSIKGLEEFDAHPDVFICLAHDTGLIGVLPMLNDSSEDIGDWKAKGYKEITKWRFLNELPRDGKQGRPRIVEGFWRNGVQVPTFDS